ncbi:MAG: hypothetical protein ABI679_03355 [Gemmatimonadota bacterium]
MRYRAIVLALISITLAPSLHAQQTIAGRLSISSPSVLAFHATSAMTKLPQLRNTSHWAEGGGVGAALLGLLGIVVGAGLCSESDTRSESCFAPTVGLGILGAGVGFTVGALVGARFPKH